jgi:hypothetical protein
MCHEICGQSGCIGRRAGSGGECREQGRWAGPGIQVSAASDASKAGTLLAVALIFGIINAILKPIIHTLGCAFYVLTLGLAALV